ncbi:40S ribosomal protein S26 [Gregarina niphandrodes]|uniref:40S ribosomal protein S26 n=1 Tax=Gregarina niphandrodes TaxID=110365 RepID=A0A023BB91_GRENI|nr:40S ribosomal protein S26 [Gregarina niphandrodes]EZG79294.1 40S ribosomal protein S26 [Gregarina niphandrodes]|eukprot:XP_011129079.1 40S ribosomal protein S26 [Gregarina niphandrodes]
MPSKRRNNGRGKKNCGHIRNVRCVNCGRCVPKDKAIKRYNVRNIVDASSRKDIKENSIFENYNLPKLYIQQIYCISCGIHSRIVRSRSRADRKIRYSPSKSMVTRPVRA